MTPSRSADCLGVALRSCSLHRRTHARPVYLCSEARRLFEYACRRPFHQRKDFASKKAWLTDPRVGANLPSNAPPGGSATEFEHIDRKLRASAEIETILQRSEYSPAQFRSKYPSWHCVDFIDALREKQRLYEKRRLATAAEEFRGFMRLLPQPAVVVTAMTEFAFGKLRLGPQEQIEEFRGALVSSITSVSLNPAFICFNLRLDSGTLKAMTGSQYFTVHLLEANEAGARLASHFIKRSPGAHQVSHQTAWQSVARTNEIGVVKAWSIRRKCYRPEAPLISGPGVAGHLYCKLSEKNVQRVADHAILVARVLKCLDPVSASDPPRTGEKSDGLMLSYSDGQFKTQGSQLHVPEPFAEAPSTSGTDEDADRVRPEIPMSSCDGITKRADHVLGQPVLRLAAEGYMESVVRVLEESSAPRDIVHTLQKLRLWAESVTDSRVSIAAGLVTQKIRRDLKARVHTVPATVEALNKVLAGPDEVDHFFELFEGLPEAAADLLELEINDRFEYIDNHAIESENGADVWKAESKELKKDAVDQTVKAVHLKDDVKAETTVGVAWEDSVDVKWMPFSGNPAANEQK